MRLWTRPRPPGTTLFPYTTLFRSRAAEASGRAEAEVVRADAAVAAAEEEVRRMRASVRSLSDELDDARKAARGSRRSEEHTSELQSHVNLVCRLLLEKKKLRLRES